MKRIVFATRGSTLALWQTRRIAQHVRERWPAIEIAENVIRTRGDEDRTSALPDIGGAGVFTEMLEHALLDGSADVAVHSLKDLPIEQRQGLALAAVCFREDAHDVLLTRDGAGLAALKAGAIVGTSSHRRSAQIRASRPDVDVRPIRGNVDTRIAKLDAGEYDAIVLAAAGVLRLGLEARIAERLPLDTFLPAPGQGALAVQCRIGSAAFALLQEMDDANVRLCTDAERRFLAHLGGGCSLPVGAFALLTGDDLHLRGFVGSRSGASAIRVEEHTGRARAEAAAAALAERAIARGALRLLAE